MAQRSAQDAMWEAQRLFQDRSGKLIEANSQAIAQLTTVVSQQTEGINAQSTRIDNLTAATERLERAVSELVTGINAQRDVVQDMVKQQSEFLKLATRQADIIGHLAAGKAS